MAGIIPPLVSSSPPPLCPFDDDDDEDDDDFGMYNNTVEELDYNECISFKEKDEEKRNGGKSRGEQDSTSQDSATDSGLCPDSEGMSPIPHSDDERTVKQNVCDRLYQRSADQPVLSSRLTPSCDSESIECLETHPLGLPNGHVDAKDDCTLTESNDDFGDFELPPSPRLEFTEQGIESSNGLKSNLKPLETTEVNGIIPATDENLENEQTIGELQDVSDQTIELGRSKEITVDEVEFNFDPKDSFPCEFPPLEKQSNGEEIQEENITNNVKIGLENEEHEEVKIENIEFENDNEEFDDFTDFKANFTNSLDFPETEHSDRLSEHSKPFSEQEHSEEAAKSLQLAQADESDDEFSNFADFSSSDCAFVSAQSSNSLENVSHIPVKPSDDTDLRTESEFQDWVSVFPSDGSESPLGDENVLLKEDDVVWTRLFPLESSPALSYQWTESLANRRLLSALNIDSRNILFMPWSNSAVPRFAANLSCGPLEPVKATEPLQPALQPAPAPQHALGPFSTQESVPDAHFDWVSSGLTNPLDSSHSSLLDLNFMMTLATHLTISPKPVLNLPKTLSAEAENILTLIPDLSFMRKTYIDFPINDG